MRVTPRLQRLWHWRTIVGILAALVLIGMVVFDWISPGDRDPDDARTYWTHPASWFSEHTVTANVIYTALIAAMAWVFFDHRAMRRDQAIADSTTSIGLAGAVQPLLGITFALSWLGKPNAPTGSRADHLTSSPLKWTRGPVREGSWPKEAGTGAPLRAEDADTVGECIREVVGTVRDWATLFTSSTLGREAAFCMQSLRVELQELQRCIEQDDPEDVAHGRLSTVRARAVFMAVNFEDASGPLRRRTELESLLQCPWARQDLADVAQSVGLDAAQATTESTVDRTAHGRMMVQALFEHLKG